MSLAAHHIRAGGALNIDIFAVVIDEVIGWLNTYRRYDIIHFAGVLRLVCRYADTRIRSIALRYLDVVSATHLVRLVKLGVPNAPYLRSVTLHTMFPRCLIGRFFATAGKLDALERLIFQDCLWPSDDLGEEEYWLDLDTFPTSMSELSFITSPSAFAAGYQDLFQDGFTNHMPCVRRLALFGVSLSSITFLPMLVEDLVISVETTARQLAMLRHHVATGFGPFNPRRLRLLFMSEFDSSKSQLTAVQKRTIASTTYAVDLIVEELQPVEDDIAAWFTERVEDGTIWTMPAVNLRAPPSSS